MPPLCWQQPKALVAVALALVVAVVCARAAHAAVPKHFSQLTYAEWGVVPTEPCVHQVRVASVAVDPQGMDAYTFAAEVQSRVLDLCRGTLLEPDCRSAVWTPRPNTRYGVFDVELCGHTRAQAPGATDTSTTHGAMELCDNDGSVRILCRPPSADVVARSMRSATFGTPYTTLCERNATICACSTEMQASHTWLDDTCNPIPCPGGCSGHGTCNSGTMTCTCEWGYFGDDCASTCVHVSPQNGEVCSGHGACTGAGGICECDEGYEGELCDACVSGYYGPGMDCSFQCPVVEDKGLCGGFIPPGVEPRGWCDPYQGCICKTGSFLDPRTGCDTCLPGTDWDDFHYSNNFERQCRPRGLCRVPKHELLGLGAYAETNSYCASEDSFYTTAWCEPPEEQDGEFVLPDCAPRLDVPPCNGHGTCISSDGDVPRVGSVVVPPRPSSMAINAGQCVYTLTESGVLVEQSWPNSDTASCGANEGVRSAGHFTGDEEDQFTHLTRCGSTLVAATAKGEIWTLEANHAPAVGKWEGIDYDAHRQVGDAVIDLVCWDYSPCALIGRVLYTTGWESVQATARRELPETLVPTYVTMHKRYLTIATRSGDWWVEYTASTSTTLQCCDVHPTSLNIVPVESFGEGHRAVYLHMDYHDLFALLTSGVYRRWDKEAREWTTEGLWGQEAYGYYVGTLDARVRWWEPPSPTTPPSVYVDTLLLDPDSQVVVDMESGQFGNDHAVMLESGNMLMWGNNVPGGVVEFDPSLTTGLKPMAAQPLEDRFFVPARLLGVGGQAGGNTVASEILGTSLPLPDPHATLPVQKTCMCDHGWSGAFCTVPMHCKTAAGGLPDVGCLSGLTPGTGYNPSLDLVLTGAGGGDAMHASLPEHVRPIGLPPPITSRMANTRIHVLRQQEVFLDLRASFLKVTGTTTVDARRYTPARAEYLCYRAHRSGRVLHDLDAATIRPLDLQSLARELDSPSTGPATSDGLFWVRTNLEGGGWGYVAKDKAMNTVRTFVDAEPTVVANVVCAYDEDSLLSTPPALDAYAKCKLPAWFCHLWTQAASLSYCGWMETAAAE